MYSSVRRHVKKTTRDQFEMLIRELKRHPEILKRTAYFGTNKIKADQVWEMISQKLNSIGPPLRTVIEWKKIWADLKSRRKKSIYNGNPNNINMGPTEDDDLLTRENLIDAEDSSDRIVLDLLSAPALSPQSIIEYEIEEIELQPTNSIKMELHGEDMTETVEESNALETPVVRGEVFGLGEYQLEHPTTAIKSESPSNVIESSDEAETLNAREPTPPPPQAQQQQQRQQPTRLTSPKALRYSIKNRPTQLKNQPQQHVESASSTLLRQQLQNQTHLLEALTNSIISLTDRQAAAAERQALATERQAAATERQAAAMEAVLEHFRARQYADHSRSNIHRNK